MRQILAAFLLFSLVLTAGAARADYEQSRTWFEALPLEERTETQANLTLLGHYEYLVDGQFGRGTYQAVTAFQHDLGRAQTGVLLPRDRDRLLVMAAEVYSELGMDLVRDKEGQAALIMPVGLLTVRTQGERGNSYATPDGGIVLDTLRRPIGEQAFRRLFESLNSPGNGRFITYSNFNEDRFVVSGKADGRLFYTMFQNAETDSVGYTLSWTAENSERANMLAIFIASHFTALRYMPAEEGGTKVAESSAATQRFGVFTLPANAPDAIMLNGEVTHTLASDFRRALAARPNADLIVLNSPGGYVDNALQVAREVKKRGMATLVAEGMGCYSACAYIFFAGEPRFVEGELGVHQISAEIADLVLAQTTLSDVLDALDEFGVEQPIISVMLRTPPEDMYVFTPQEVSDLGINHGAPIQSADLSTLTTATNEPSVGIEITPGAPFEVASPGAAYVVLSLQGTRVEADRSLEYIKQRWAGVLGGAVPEIVEQAGAGGVQYHVRVAARSGENANALCAAIKSAGGGCFVTR